MEVSESQTSAWPSRAGMSLVHAGFILTGVVTTMLGPLLPWLSARWTLTDAQAGYFFSVQFLASTAGVLLSGVLVPWLGFRNSLLLGYAAMAAGAGSLARGSWILGLGSVACCGLGLGLVIPGTNLLIAKARPERRAAALNLLNLAWGAGAVACPLFLATFQAKYQLFAFLLGLAVALLALAAGLAGIPESSLACGPAQTEPVWAVESSAWRDRAVLILAALFFLYIGTEASVSGWVASHARRLGTASASQWILMPAFFWVSLLLGRGAAPALLKRMTEVSLARLGLLLAAVGMVFLLAAKLTWQVAAATSLAGFGLSTVFPITIAQLSHRFGERAARLGAPLFALAGVGGAVLPWLVGYSSTRFGHLRAGLVVPLLGAVVMLALYCFWDAPAAPKASR